MSKVSQPMRREGARSSERVIAYVDGMNLYHGIRSAGEFRHLWLDVRELATKLLRPHQVLSKAKYYTARYLPGGDDDRTASQQITYLNALGTYSNVEIVEGKYQRKTGECRSCGNKWQSYEEKMTDVNIAVDLVFDAEDDTFDMALLISGDGDLTRPIARVLSRHPHKRVIVAFPPNRRSGLLASAATGYISIVRSSLRNSQLPDVVVSGDGYPLRRPAEWS